MKDHRESTARDIERIEAAGQEIGRIANEALERIEAAWAEEADRINEAMKDAGPGQSYALAKAHEAARARRQ